VGVVGSSGERGATKGGDEHCEEWEVEALEHMAAGAWGRARMTGHSVLGGIERRGRRSVTEF
jgi:hypothetical protein